MQIPFGSSCAVLRYNPQQSSISLSLVMALKKREGERVGEEKMHGRGLSPDFPASQHESNKAGPISHHTTVDYGEFDA
jgi:hypothetical protein